MEFSVYIIQDRTKKNEDIFKKLAGDIGIGMSLANEGLDMVTDVAGAEVYDPYADPKIIGETGIVIRGDMISNVSIKKEITKREIYEGGFTKPFTNNPKATLMTTITVTGNLFAPEITQKSSSEKLKNMARVLAWASLPEKFSDEYPKDSTKDHGDIKDNGDATQLRPNIQRIYHDDTSPNKNGASANDTEPANKKKNDDKYASYYFRRVLVTVYSNTDMQFRAVLHDWVYVSSYEETYTDKDGNGSFTLVMQTATPSTYDVIVEGPTYGLSIISATDAIATTVEKIVDVSDRVIQTVDKGMGLDGKLSGPTDKIAQMTKNVANLLRAPSDFSDRLTVDNLLNKVDGRVNDVRYFKEEIPELQKELDKKDPSINDIIDQAAQKKKKQDEYQDKYNDLTPGQKQVLNSIPGFDNMSIDDKTKYVDEVSKRDVSYSAPTNTTITITTTDTNVADETKTINITKTSTNTSDTTKTINVTKTGTNTTDTTITITTK
ncbi:MAG: hypothetical protein IKZ58_00365 [Selenomonadaceae bacterium]|nr:hypothetical protein [Selenomonadaceae bacterium]